MEAKLKTDSIAYLKNVLDVSFTQEETLESIVPDALPDMREIVDVAGNVTLRGKETGAGRVSLNGTVAAAVIYLPDGAEGLHKIDLSVPFTTGYDLAELTEDAKVTITAKIASIDARIINSRKVLVRADVLLEIQGFEPAMFACNADFADSGDIGLRLRREETEVSFVSQVREKTFVVTDAFQLPAGRAPLGELLGSRVRLEADDVKSVGNKLIVKGFASIHVFYAAEHTMEPSIVDFTTSFSQIFEMDGEAEGAVHDLSFMLTNVYIENGAAENASIAAELHMVAQVVEKRNYKIPYISDAYSTKFELSEAHTEYNLESMDAARELLAELRETLEVPGGVMRVIDCCVKTGKVEPRHEGGRLIFAAPVCVSAVYVTDEGQIAGLSRRFEATAEMEGAAHMRYHASVCALEEPQVMPTANGVEVRVSVRFCVRPCRSVRFRALNGVRWDEEHPRDIAALPSVVVFTAEGGENLWNLAKRHCSTEELIAGANGIDTEMVPYPGQLFVIPKAR